MTLGEEGGGTVGLEQAAIVGCGGADCGTCVAGEGREEGGEADHDDESGGVEGGDGDWGLGAGERQGRCLCVCVCETEAR